MRHQSETVQSPEERSKRAGTSPLGDQPQNWRATGPKNGGHQPKDWQAIFFITVGNHEFFLDFGDCVSEVVRSF